MRLRIVLLLLLGALSGYGQNTIFGVNTTRGVVPLRYTITVTSVSIPGTNFQYGVNTDRNYADNTPLVTSLGIINSLTGFSATFTISAVGVYNHTINQGGEFKEIGNYRIEVLDTITPQISIRNCTGRNAELTLINPIYDEYNINWGDGIITTVGNNSKTNRTITHTYTTSGDKTIFVEGIYNLTATSPFSKTVTRNTRVFDGIVSAIFTKVEVNSINGDSTVLTVSTDSSFSHLLFAKYGSGSYQTTTSPIIGTQGVSTPVTLSIGYPSQTTCYKFTSYDKCNNSLDSREICTTPISATATENGNLVKYGPNDIWPYLMNLSVGGALIQSDAVPPANPAERIYNDTNVICRIQYTYRAEAYNSQQGWSSISAPVTVQAIRRSPLASSPVSGFYATYANDAVRLYWDNLSIPGTNYNIYGEPDYNTNRLIFITSLTTNQFIINRPQYKCYKIQINDLCGVSNPVTACPTYLYGEAIDISTNSIRWVEPIFADSNQIIDYTLEFYAQGQGTNTPYRSLNGAGTPGNSISDFLHAPIDTFSQVTVYRIVATLADGTVLYSAFYPIKQSVRLFMPTAFTPNGDGVNDIYFPKGLFWDEYELTIYNRWGQTVFTTTDKNKGWGGGEFNPDIYHYVARVRDQFGEEIVKKGTLQLIR